MHKEDLKCIKDTLVKLAGKQEEFELCLKNIKDEIKEIKKRIETTESRNSFKDSWFYNA